MSIGVEDYCLELGVEPSADGLELLYPVARLVTVCKAVGVQATGLVGSIAGFRDLATFEGAAQRARQLGCEGAGCIHPDQVTVLNRVFTPDPAKVEYARRVVEAYRGRRAARHRLGEPRRQDGRRPRVQAGPGRAGPGPRGGRNRAPQGRRSREERMSTHRRVNVASGRQLEQTAHYSRALRVGDTVLQSGTTAIDRQGNVRGEGDVARQVDAIMTIARWSMGKAGGRLDDVVRSRIYVTDIGVADAAGRAVARYFDQARPAATLVQVNGLARPDPAHRDRARRGRRRRQPRPSACPPVVRWSRSTPTRAPSGSATACSSRVPPRSGRAASRVPATCTARRAPPWTRSSARWPRPVARPATSSTPRRSSPTSPGAPTTRARSSRRWATCAPCRPCWPCPRLVHPELLVEIEAEAVIGAARTRRDIYTEHMREKPRGYARAVVVGDAI